MPDRQDVVIASADAALDMVGTDAFAKMTVYALRLVGAEVARHVDDDERPGLFAPISMWIDGKERFGGVLALKDRAIVGWTVGTLRIENFESVIPYDLIRSINVASRPGGALSSAREVLRIDADSRWDLVFANIFEGGRSIVPFLQGLMEGWMSLVFEGDAESQGPSARAQRDRQAAADLLLG